MSGLFIFTAELVVGGIVGAAVICILVVGRNSDARN
jgi:hypothetical protein